MDYNNLDLKNVAYQRTRA